MKNTPGQLKSIVLFKIQQNKNKKQFSYHNSQRKSPGKANYTTA